MSIADLVSRITVLLRESLTVPVEEYWRSEPPTALTVSVQPVAETQKSLAIGGVWVDVMSLEVVCEAPWDDCVSTAHAVVAVVEAVKALPEQHRDLRDAAGQVMATRGALRWVRYRYVSREQSGVQCLAGTVRIDYEAAT